MSKLGFQNLIAKYDDFEKDFLKDGISLAQKEFSENFDNETNSETGQSWADVKRGVPPPILNVTGNLKSQTLDIKNVVFRKGSAVLTVDPIDARGRGYAKYHQDGFNHLSAGWIDSRSFLTQSPSLTFNQKLLLEKLADKFFN